VKYKLTTGQWNRPDLYQVMAFAAALGSVDAAILNFTHRMDTGESGIHAGDYHVQQISWPAGISDPALAARLFAHAVMQWTFETLRRHNPSS
jgi:hypothetical protein